MIMSRTGNKDALQIAKMYLQLIHPAVFSKPLSFQRNPDPLLVQYRFFYSSSPCYLPKVWVSKPITARLNKALRTEAEDALCDYLHCTRGMLSTDAEYISKNCPIFVDNILSKVKNEEEAITRSLSRFFCYNPINEFEPFLESLNLTPSEIPPLLQRDLMFLSDDELMLENYRILCDYGIPRSRIGKMYKEEREIFGYDNGVLALKLRAYEELGLSVTTVVKLVSCCPSLLVGGVSEDFVEVLGKLRGFGIQSDWIAGHMSVGGFYNWKRMLDLICFLEKVSSSDGSVEKLFKKYPRFLVEDSGKKVYVLVALLLKVGLKMDDIYVLLLEHPRVISGGFAKSFRQAVLFLLEIGMEPEDITKIVRSHTGTLGNSSLRKPPTVLSKQNIQPGKLCKLIKEDPLNLISLASRLNPGEITSERGGRLMEKTTFLQSIGYVDNSEEMVKALKVFRGRGDLLQERFDCLVKAGLGCHVVGEMIRRVPLLINQSKDVLEMKIQYLVNDLGLPIVSLEKFPSYLCYNIETIKLRFSMCMWLKEKGITKRTNLSTVLACSDSRFVKYYVDVHPDGPAEWERRKQSSSSSSS